MSPFSCLCYEFQNQRAQHPEQRRSGSVNALAEGLNATPPLTVPRDQNQSNLPTAVGLDLTGLCALQMPCLKTEVRGRDSNKDINGYWTGHLTCLKKKLLEWHDTVYSGQEMASIFGTEEKCQSVPLPFTGVIDVSWAYLLPGKPAARAAASM